MPVITASVKTSFIKVEDSSVKKFLKDFFNFRNTRYEVARSKTDQMVIETIAKPHNVALNIFKVVLCFTVVVPVIAGIYQLIEMRSLKEFKLTVIDPKKEDAENLKSETTASKIDALFSKNELQIKNSSQSAELTPVAEKLFKDLHLIDGGKESLQTFKDLIIEWKLVAIDIIDSDIMPEGCKYTFTVRPKRSDVGILYLTTDFLKKVGQAANNKDQLLPLLNQVVDQIKIANAGFYPEEEVTSSTLVNQSEPPQESTSTDCPISFDSEPDDQNTVKALLNDLYKNSANKNKLDKFHELNKNNKKKVNLCVLNRYDKKRLKTEAPEYAMNKDLVEKSGSKYFVDNQNGRVLLISLKLLEEYKNGLFSKQLGTYLTHLLVEFDHAIKALQEHK